MAKKSGAVADRPEVIAVQPPLMPTELPAAQYAPEILVDALPLEGDMPGVAPSPALIQSVAEYGVLQPIVLIVNTKTQAVHVSDGRRRILAARKAGRLFLPVLSYHVADEAAVLPLMTLLAHLRKANAPAEAAALASLLDQGMSEEDVRRKTGRSKAQVTAAKRLTDLHPTLKQAVETGDIAIGVAQAAAKLPAAAQERLVARFEENEEHLTDTDVREIRQARAVNAVSLLPESLFAPLPEVACPCGHICPCHDEGGTS